MKYDVPQPTTATRSPAARQRVGVRRGQPPGGAAPALGLTVQLVLDMGHALPLPESQLRATVCSFLQDIAGFQAESSIRGKLRSFGPLGSRKDRGTESPDVPRRPLEGAAGAARRSGAGWRSRRRRPKLDVSAATIRRDFDQLAEQQMLIRTRGGAVAHGVSYDLPLRYKTARHASEKQRIAKAVAGLVSPGEAVGLTGGTTTHRGGPRAGRTRRSAPPSRPR